MVPRRQNRDGMMGPGRCSGSFRRDSEDYRGMARCEGYISVSVVLSTTCLLYTSDAADEEDSVDLGGRRIIKKKKKEQKLIRYHTICKTTIDVSIHDHNYTRY
eukprot:TRINITY_DN17888_c0_g1_i2.p1 TRINITY_DN17888_c0_g1~~TRINITY_DN17888_c0_g1_i2.p1  ORF type:complete len:103 (-),score=4.57 TRINITY_DN17888_c0_g1_i2:28-336(-)